MLFHWWNVFMLKLGSCNYDNVHVFHQLRICLIVTAIKYKILQQQMYSSSNNRIILLLSIDLKEKNPLQTCEVFHAVICFRGWGVQEVLDYWTWACFCHQKTFSNVSSVISRYLILQWYVICSLWCLWTWASAATLTGQWKKYWVNCVILFTIPFCFCLVFYKIPGGTRLQKRIHRSWLIASVASLFVWFAAFLLLFFSTYSTTDGPAHSFHIPVFFT